MSGFSSGSSQPANSGPSKPSRAERRKLAEQEAQQRIATELNRSKPIDVTGKPSPSQKESRGCHKAELNNRAEQLLQKAEEEAKSRVERLKQEKLDDYHKLVANSDNYGTDLTSRAEIILQKAEEEARCRVERLKQEKLDDYHKLLADSEALRNVVAVGGIDEAAENAVATAATSSQSEVSEAATTSTLTEGSDSAPGDRKDASKRTEKRHGSISAVAALWEKRVHDYEEKQSHNPFSDRYVDTYHLHKGEEGYGKPAEGSATDERGQKAHEWVDEEIGKLKEHILCIHTERHTEEGDDKNITASFREIFERYEDISNSVVGILKRARTRGVVHFVGQSAPDMLYQGTDDEVIIELIS